VQIIRHYTAAPDALKGSVIALGNFDGVHRGHKIVMDTAASYAKALNAPCAVMTFEPHPVTRLKPGTPPLRITSFYSKMQRIRQCGMDAVYALHFTEAFSQLPAEQFIEEVLIGHLQVRHIVIGYDFIFGHKRSGNGALLAEKAAEAGIGFTQVPPVTHLGALCSSSAIRESLRKGDVTQASTMLGYTYQITGKVTHGEERGRLLGFPTANIRLHDLLRPALGVYAVQVRIAGDDKRYNAVANLGKKPTFNDAGELLEVHIFDFAGDIYGRRLTVYFRDFLRPEQKFATIDALRLQIAADCEATRIILTTGNFND
jgi:riboflavin kinase / FMN adenylyltransferase